MTGIFHSTVTALRIRGWCMLLALMLALSGVSAAVAQSPGFWRAIEANDIDSLRTELLRGANPNARHPEHGPAIVAAARFKSFDAVRVLASLNATDVDAASSADETALMLISLLGDRRAFDALLQRGAQVNRPGWTPLHYAASGGQLELVKVLIDQHAFIDAQSANGTTALMMAARMRALPIVQYLIDQGADPSLRNQAGLDAAAYLERNGERQWAIWMKERVQRYVARYGTVEQPRWTSPETASAAGSAGPANTPADLGAVQMNREVNVAPESPKSGSLSPALPAAGTMAGQGAAVAPASARMPAPSPVNSAAALSAPATAANPTPPAKPPAPSPAPPPAAAATAAPLKPAPPATPSAPASRPTTPAASATAPIRPVAPIAPAASAPIAPTPSAAPTSPSATSSAPSSASTPAAASPKPPAGDSEPLFFSRTLTIPADPPVAPPAAGRR